MLRRVALLVPVLVLLAASAARADITVTYNPPSGPAADDIRIVGVSGDNQVTITQTQANFVISLTTGTITPSGCSGTGPVMCPLVPSLSIDLGAGNDSLSTNNVTSPLLVTGGAGNDVIAGGQANDVLAGGDGNDTLIGNGGVDQFFGEGGNDTIQAKDGNPEQISCGAGDDVANNDFTDIIAECERGVDADGDGFSTAVDCNDANAAIHPGARDVIANGIDEDCDGRDAIDLDKDRDGFPVPADCNDANPKIHPGAREIRGNKVDENCDSRADPFALLRSLVATNWQVTLSFTRVRGLVVRNAPKGAHASVACSGRGCPFKGRKTVKVKRDLQPVSLRRFFGAAKLRVGAHVIVTVTASQTVGRTYTYAVKRAALPSVSIVCRNPGQKKGRAC